MSEIRDIRIHSAVIDEKDISMIVDPRNRVVLEHCYIEDLDIATTNKMVRFYGCSFMNSELIAPDIQNQVSNCVFRCYKGEKLKRNPVRKAKVVSGYHTPVCKPKYA